MQLLGTGTQRAAKTSRVQVASQNLTFASWEANDTVGEALTTNFESYNSTDDETYEEGIRGVRSCSARFGGAWDAAVGARPTVNPPGLYPRDNLASVNLITSRTDGIQWAFPYLRIRGTTNSGAVEGLVLFNVTDAKNQGRFTSPGNS